MSRSYKHTPIYKSKYYCPCGKKLASKAVRQALKSGEYLPKGCQYKKIYDSWSVIDYSSYCPKTNENWWYQCYFRK